MTRPTLPDLGGIVMLVCAASVVGTLALMVAALVKLILAAL